MAVSTHTIPLRKAWLRAPRYGRAKRAINEIKSYVTRHTKKEYVKIGEQLNEEVWKHGMKNPPPRISVDIDVQEEFSTVELKGVKFVDKTKVESDDKQPEGIAGKVQQALGTDKKPAPKKDLPTDIEVEATEVDEIKDALGGGKEAKKETKKAAPKKEEKPKAEAKPAKVEEKKAPAKEAKSEAKPAPKKDAKAEDKK